MKDPTRHLRAGAKTAIDSAMSTAGKTCPVRANPSSGQALPYIGLGWAYVEPRHTVTEEGTTSFHTYIVYSDSPTEAMELADIVLQALTNRSTPITVDASVKLISSDLDFISEAVSFDTPDSDQLRYGVPIRIKYRTHE